ncbi:MULTISPECIES: glycosyltransferase family 4 protein [Aestuariivivens]|uniref:glycosyltransferase family 4 protein n=1 Tax=Aestuariivivens TaxID=1820275 RepID=UPI001CBE8A2E|nr:MULTISPECIES: glycosyltransferase family 4 protein [Aestuariivivens]
MRIGIVLAKTPQYSETFFISKIKGLQTNGFDITLFVQDKHPDFSLCQVRIAPKFYKQKLFKQLLVSVCFLFKFLVYYKRFRRFIQLEQRAGRLLIQSLKNAYNNVHILTAKLDWLHFGFATIAIQSEHVAKAIGANMTVSFRGFDLDVYPLKHPGCYNLLWQRVDKVHSISMYLLQKAYALGLPKNIPHQIITPAVDLSLFKEEPFVKNNPVRFVTVARLHWIKGLQATLEALALLKAKGMDFKYHIIGDGPKYETLMFTIHQLGLSQYVALVGKLAHKETLKELAQADIYIQYSYSEGFCNAVLESQAMGLLCVVSDGGGLPENVLHEKTGWVVEKGKPKKLAKTLLDIINLSEAPKNKIRNQARTRVIEAFGLEKQKMEFCNFFTT